MKRLCLDAKTLKRLYYQEKMKPTDIAKHFKCSEGAVRNEMVRQNFILRGVKESHAHLDGNKNPAWKGGKQIVDGYVLIYTGIGDPKKRRQKEHRIIWESINGKLPKGWVVHHLNGIRNDNRIENLYAVSRSGHSKLELADVYKKRIRQLERQLKEFQNGTKCLPLALD